MSTTQAESRTSTPVNLGVKAAGASSSIKPTGKPNVVLYIVDDLAIDDTAMASPNHKSRHRSSPVMDTLARTGTAFTQASAMPNCAPTRAAMLTGTAPTDPNNQIYAVNSLSRYPADPLTTPPRQGLGPSEVIALNKDATTYAEVLASSGYATGTVGKFHASDTHEHITTWHGFQYSVGGSGSGYARAYHAKATSAGRRFGSGVDSTLDKYAADYTHAYVKQNIAPFSTGLSAKTVDKLVGTRKNVSDAVADAGIDFITQATSQRKPFMLNAGSFSVHAPIGAKQVRRDLRVKYKVPTGGQPGNLRPAYDGIVEGTDQALGRLLHKLNTTADPTRKGRTLADNTIVFVTSDNGGVIRYQGDLGNLRGEKSTLWEGGVRVPWVVWSKNKALVPAGKTRGQGIVAQDFYPTVLEAAGVVAPNEATIDGVSWWKAVRNGKHRPRNGKSVAKYGRVIHFPGYIKHTGTRPTTTIREGRWKLYYRHETASWHLYNLLVDPSEKREVTRRHPEVAHRLGKHMVNWLARHNAPLTTLKATGVTLTNPSFTGIIYANSQKRTVTNMNVVVRAGEPVPIMLPSNPAQLAPVGAARRKYLDGTSVQNNWKIAPAATQASR